MIDVKTRDMDVVVHWHVLIRNPSNVQRARMICSSTQNLFIYFRIYREGKLCEAWQWNMYIGMPSRWDNITIMTLSQRLKQLFNLFQRQYYFLWKAFPEIHRFIPTSSIFMLISTFQRERVCKKSTIFFFQRKLQKTVMFDQLEVHKAKSNENYSEK